MLTEQEITRSWRRLFKGGNFSDETFARAEELISELRPESPLRHRLVSELEEIRKVTLQKH